jgi:N utilization substance protein B
VTTMQARRTSRQAALQVLYGCDTLSDFTPSRVELLVSHAQVHQGLDSDGEDVQLGDEGYFRELVEGVIGNLEGLDAQISLACQNWSVARMSRIDRNIIRIAAFELLHRADIPAKVSINEAIEIAKIFAADESPNFINGVLDRLKQSKPS